MLTHAVVALEGLVDMTNKVAMNASQNQFEMWCFMS